MVLIRKLITSLLDLFYPSRCVHCGVLLQPGEQYLCKTCFNQLPLTYFVDLEDNLAAKIFWGRVPFIHGWSYLHFEKHQVAQSVLHAIKYRGMSDMAVYFGTLAAKRFLDRFVPVYDAVVPVPLHPRKQKLRGYNQAEMIALGLSKEFKIPVYSTVVERTVFTQTQTKLSVQERWQNVQGIFRVSKPTVLSGKHLLLVDDVLTTGATLESLATTLLSEVADVKLSFMTLAIARNI